MTDLNGKTILLTGSSRGIGAATAKIVASAGGKPVLHGRSESAALRSLAQELQAPYIYCDVSDRASVFEVMAKVSSEHGPIHGLVNSAGLIRPKSFLETDERDWDEAIDVNLKGSAWFCQSVIPAMRDSGGSIVNIASMRGLPHIGSPGSVPYATSKGAIINMTAVLAKEFGPEVRVNCVAPGFVETDMSKKWSPAIWERAKTATLGRVAQPREIGEVVAFLLSDSSSFITGQMFLADGGYAMAEK